MGSLLSASDKLLFDDFQILMAFKFQILIDFHENRCSLDDEIFFIKEIREVRVLKGLFSVNSFVGVELEEFVDEVNRCFVFYFTKSITLFFQL